MKKDKLLSLTEKFAIGVIINGRNSPLKVCIKADVDSKHKEQGISNNIILFRTN